MTLDPQNLPFLHRELSQLQAQYNVLAEAAEGDKYATDGKRRVSERELNEVSGRVDELSYVLRRLAELEIVLHAREHNETDSRIGVNLHTIAAWSIANAAILILILILLFRGG